MWLEFCKALVTRYVLPRSPNFTAFSLFILVFGTTAIIHQQFVVLLREHMMFACCWFLNLLDFLFLVHHIFLSFNCFYLDLYYMHSRTFQNMIGQLKRNHIVIPFLRQLNRVQFLKRGLLTGSFSCSSFNSIYLIRNCTERRVITYIK